MEQEEAKFEDIDVAEVVNCGRTELNNMMDIILEIRDELKNRNTIERDAQIMVDGMRSAVLEWHLDFIDDFQISDIMAKDKDEFLMLHKKRQTEEETMKSISSASLNKYIKQQDKAKKNIKKSMGGVNFLRRRKEDIMDDA